MKKVLLFLVLGCLTTTVFAQGLDFLKNEANVGMKLNFAEANIAGFNESNIMTFEKDWEKDQPILLMKMIEHYNNKMAKKLPASTFADGKYTIEARPVMIKKNGKITGYFVVLNADGTEMYRSAKFKAEGGTFGSFLNLLGDGMKSTGDAIAKIISKELKKK